MNNLSELLIYLKFLKFGMRTTSSLFFIFSCDETDEYYIKCSDTLLSRLRMTAFNVW